MNLPNDSQVYSSNTYMYWRIHVPETVQDARATVGMVEPVRTRCAAGSGSYVCGSPNLGKWFLPDC